MTPASYNAKILKIDGYSTPVEEVNFCISEHSVLLERYLLAKGLLDILIMANGIILGLGRIPRQDNSPLQELVKEDLCPNTLIAILKQS